MAYALATLSTLCKLGLALCLAHDGDALGAAVVACLSPALFLMARDTRVAR